MRQLLSILSGWSLTVLTSYVLGQLLFARLRLRLFREEQRLLAFVCGASILHLIVFTLMAAQAARKAVFLIVAIIVTGSGWYRGIFAKSTLPQLPPLPRLWRILFGVIFSVYAFLYLVNAMAPEMSPDGSAYHLGLVSRYLREHGFSFLRNNLYGNLTQGVEMLYAFAFAFGRHSAASLVHCTFTLALPLLMLAHGKRFGFAAAGACGAVLMLCSPLTGVTGTTAYNDVAATTIVFSTFCLLCIYAEERQAALLIPIGLLAGFAFASKYTAALVIPFAAFFLLWTQWRARKPLLRPLFVYSGCVSLMAFPWLAKNWIIVGNPLSPFANRFFPNPYVTIAFEQEYVQMMRHYGNPKSYWDIPADLTLHGAMLSGMLGAVFVLLPLALLALRSREGRRLLLTGLLFASPYLNNIGARFLLPSLPFLSLALALACARSPGIIPVLALVHATLSWPFVLRNYCSQYAWRLEHVPVAAALRITPEEKYLTERSAGYPVARMIEEFVPPGEKVFTFGGIAEAYTSRDILVAYQAGLNNNLGQAIWTGLFEGEAPVRRLTFEYPEKNLKRLRLRQTSTSAGEHWSVNEWRVLFQGKEVPRAPEWRLHAWPNPWDVELAFDNNPATRWRSWEALRPGMILEVDFGGTRKTDSIVLEQTHNQANAVIELYGMTLDGKWERLGGEGKVSAVQKIRGLRRAAMDELRAKGVHYVISPPDDPTNAEYKMNAPLWGLTALGERNGWRLYRIDGTPQ